MNQQDELKKSYMKGIYELARISKIEMNDWVLEAYCSVFEDRYQDGIKALKIAFMRIRGNGQMPSAIDLLELLGEKMPSAPSTKDDANAIAGNIIDAISRFGSYNAIKAKEFLGDKAWRLIDMSGGWSVLCDIENDQIPAWRAQLRDLAESLEKKDHFEKQKQLGEHQNVFQLPSSNRP